MDNIENMLVVTALAVKVFFKQRMGTWNFALY